VSAPAERPVLLIVDDEPSILSALRRALRREAFEVVTADSGAAALRVLGERRVDALLTDHKMPGMSGLELVREVAARHPGIPTFLLTGWAAELDPAELRRLGIRALVGKPWEDAELKARLREVLGG
jgi:response regulator RpfG family c-di-GMP phosphodiesterase